MKTSTIAIILAAVLVIVIVGFVLCVSGYDGYNRQLIDTKWNYNRAYIQTPNGWEEVEVKSWNDWDDSDMLQVVTPDNITYYTHSTNIILINNP